MVGRQLGVAEAVEGLMEGRSRGVAEPMVVADEVIQVGRCMSAVGERGGNRESAIFSEDRRKFPQNFRRIDRQQ